MSSETPVICHVIPYISREFGGPVMAMAAMVDSLILQDHNVAVHSVIREGEGQSIDIAKEVPVSIHKDSIWGQLRHSRELWGSIDKANVGLVHSHGLWTDVNRCAATLAGRKGVPHVIGPCGMLDRGALLRSLWKKRMVGAWFQWRALREASCLLANSKKEYDDIRFLGLKNPVAIVPNPVPSPTLVKEGLNSKGRSLFPKDRKTLLFLGRIHPVKGLKRLVETWSRLTDFHSDWQLVLAGPDENNHRAEIERLIEILGCHSSVCLIGALDNDEKWRALQVCDLFVMPSEFENFGIAIAEALLAKKPVITTIGTPWESLHKYGAGWWVDASIEALHQALNKAMSLDDGERQSMGLKGLEVAEAFSPERVGAQIESLYGWLINQDEMPDFVRLN